MYDPLFEKIGYTPHPKQALYHLSQARFRIPCCGRRFGKSVMAGRDLERKLMRTDASNRGKRYWAVGPTYDLGEKEFRVVWDDLIVKLALGRAKGMKKAYNRKQGEMYIQFPWGTRFEVRSAEHPEYLVGEALHGVIMSEAAKHRLETWERYIRPSLADFHGWADFPTTPEGFNWLYNQWQLGQNPSFPDYQSWSFPSWENPHVYPGGRQDPEILLLERTTAPEWFAQEVGADFASFVGKIYPEFDERIHVRQVDFNPKWPNYMAIDWGYTNPLAAIEFQVTPWDEVRVWREHYMSYKRLDEHIAIWKARDNPDGYRLDLCFGDAEDPEATMDVSTKFAMCISMPEAKQNWRQGIDKVKTFLAMRDTGIQDEYGTPKLEPGLTISHNCPNLIKEFNNYKVPNVSRSTTDRTESNKRGGAQKQDDHALDALRYGIMHVFELGATRHLSELVTVSELRNSAPQSGYFTMGLSF